MFKRAGVAATLLAVAGIVALAAGRIESWRPESGISSISFHAHSTGHDFSGHSGTITGRFGCDRARLAETAFGTIEIPVKNLKTGIGARDNAMYALFDVAKHPVIKYTLKQLKDIRWIGSDSFTATATGALAMHGVTVEKQVAIAGSFSGGRLTVTGSAPCRITEFGMERPGVLFIRVDDNVVVKFRMTGDTVTESRS